MNLVCCLVLFSKFGLDLKIVWLIIQRNGTHNQTKEPAKIKSDLLCIVGRTEPVALNCWAVCSV